MESKLIQQVQKHGESFKNLDWYYERANGTQKKEMIGLFFNDFLVMHKTNYATMSALEPFFSEDKIIKGLRIDKNLNLKVNLSKNAICTRSGNRIYLASCDILDYSSNSRFQNTIMLFI